MKTRDITIKFRLTKDEAYELKAYANKCGLTQSALLRTRIHRRRPKPLPAEMVWEYIDTLYEIHKDLHNDDAKQKLEVLILRLQSAFTLPGKARDGNDEDMGG